MTVTEPGQQAWFIDDPGAVDSNVAQEIARAGRQRALRVRPNIYTILRFDTASATGGRSQSLVENANTKSNQFFDKG